VPASYKQRNVAVQEKNPDSILNFYKQLISLRRSQPALRDGSYDSLNRQDDQVLSYLRKDPNSGEAVLVVLNMSSQPKTVSYDLKSQGMNAAIVKPLLSNPRESVLSMPLNAVHVAPFETFIGIVQ
jgi:alpha-glucosidase